MVLWTRSCAAATNSSLTSSSTTTLRMERSPPASCSGSSSKSRTTRGQRERALPTATPAALDALGDGDFALARQQRRGAHLAQIHAHRIGGLVALARSKVEVEVFGFLARVRLGTGVVRAGFFELLQVRRAELVDQPVDLLGGAQALRVSIDVVYGQTYCSPTIEMPSRRRCPAWAARRQSVAFRRTGIVVEESISRRSGGRQCLQIHVEVTPPALSAFSFYIKSSTRKSGGACQRRNTANCSTRRREPEEPQSPKWFGKVRVVRNTLLGANP